MDDPPLPETFKGYPVHPAPSGRNSFGKRLSPYVLREIPCCRCGAPIAMKAGLTLRNGKPCKIRNNRPVEPGAKAVKLSGPGGRGGESAWRCARCAGKTGRQPPPGKKR